MTIYGYARVSTAAGCAKVYAETASGAKKGRHRPI
jgi:hypothetical protein